MSKKSNRNGIKAAASAAAFILLVNVPYLFTKKLNTSHINDKLNMIVNIKTEEEAYGKGKPW